MVRWENGKDESEARVNLGNAIIEYYTPDSTAPEDIIIEGIDENGKVYRLTQTINK